MLSKTIGIVSAMLLVAAVWAQAISQEQLTGMWEFIAWAEADNPQEQKPIGVKMDFRADGTVISKKASGDVKASYTVTGDTIVYSDADGEQVWKVQSFRPGEAMVVSNQGALMYFEKL